jgi:hypothetical protein
MKKIGTFHDNIFENMTNFDKINCHTHDLLSHISLHVPNKGTRQSRTFYISIPRTNVLKFSPLHLLPKYNESQDNNDIFR